MKKSLIKVAICYDFDGTLAPGNMQEYGFMKTLKTTPKSFWNKSDTLSATQFADKNLCYMYLMYEEARAKHISFRKEDLASFGKDIPLFPGVDTWFKRINAYAKKNGIELQHFLLSSGLKEIVAGCPISIFHKAIQFLMTFIVPFAFVNYFPAQFLLRKDDMANYPAVFMYITPLVGLVMYLLVYVFWRYSIKYYKSSGN